MMIEELKVIALKLKQKYADDKNVKILDKLCEIVLYQDIKKNLENEIGQARELDQKDINELAELRKGGLDDYELEQYAEALKGPIGWRNLRRYQAEVSVKMIELAEQERKINPLKFDESRFYEHLISALCVRFYKQVLNKKQLQEQIADDS